jgi:hypothetical protein
MYFMIFESGLYAVDSCVSYGEAIEMARAYTLAKHRGMSVYIRSPWSGSIDALVYRTYA